MTFLSSLRIRNSLAWCRWVSFNVRFGEESCGTSYAGFKFDSDMKKKFDPLLIVTRKVHSRIYIEVSGND